jgi:site-specific recombinase XerD
MNYNLYKKGSDLYQIWITETLDERLRWYTGLRIKKKDWTGKLGRGPGYSSFNADIEKIESIYKEIKNQLKIQDKLTAHNVKFLLDCENIHKSSNYIDEIKAWIPRIELKQEFLQAFQLFIDQSESGERTTKKGKKLAKWTIKKYKVAINLLKKFSKETSYPLTWSNINDTFYTRFTNYCWYTLNHYDNSVGSVLSSICAFLNWAVEKEMIANKIYNKKWIIWKENETDALVLYPDEIQALYEMPIEEKRLQNARDNYIFGCLTCLRSANLLSLVESDLSIVGNSWYINPVQAKVDKQMSIKLHTIAIEIIKKNHGKYKTLLPYMTYRTYNKHLKEVAKLFKEHIAKDENKGLITNEWDKSFTRIRYKQGKSVKVEMDITKMLTPHTERSTGITNLLIMGLLEYEVKKISGHAKGSTSFGKYVRIAQRFVDSKSDDVWDKIFERKHLKKAV